MAVTYGFYNALNHDRLYDAIQMSSIFDGIIRDGIFSTIGDHMVVSAPEDGWYVNVGSGRAWFNHTWTLNDTDYPIEPEEAEVVLDRIDAVILEVNAGAEVRANSIKFLKGTPSSEPVKPTLTHNAEVNQYALAYVRIRAGQTTIFQADIENAIGTDETPFITGLLQQVSIETLLTQWEAEFNTYFTNFQSTSTTEFNNWLATKVAEYTLWYAQMQTDMDADFAEFDAWFQRMKDQLSEDAAGHLQAEIDELAEAAQKGSIVTVTTTDPTLFNRPVTISQTGFDPVTSSFNASGVAYFETVPMVGDVAIEATNGTLTAHGTLNIPYFGRYNTTLEFWTATLNMSTGFPTLYNRQITISSGQITVGTTTFDSTGHATYDVHSAGNYHISAIDSSSIEYTADVTVTEETTYNVEVPDVPDGSIVEPINSIPIWLKCANLNKSYTTLAEVLADTETYETLLADSNACQYMKRSTGWAGDPTVKVPTMTSNTTPSGEAFASSTYSSSYPAYYAFDGNNTTFWSSQSSGDQYVGYKFTSAVNINKLYMYPNLNSGTDYEFKLQGSNDNSTWTDLKTFEIDGLTPTYIDVNSNNSYMYYRVLRDSGWQAFTVQFYQVGITTSQDAMARLGKFDYACNTLLSNDTWKEAIINSDYCDSVYNISVPKMTSNTVPSGTAFVGGNMTVPSANAYKAFNRNPSDILSNSNWNQGANSCWVGYQFTKPVKCTVALINIGSQSSTLSDVVQDSTFVIQGSNDNSNWTDLSTIQNSPDYIAYNDFGFSILSLNNDQEFLYYRLYFYKQPQFAGSAFDINCFRLLQFYGRASEEVLVPLVPTMTSNTTPSGEAICDHQTGGANYAAYKAFDGDTSSYWYSYGSNSDSDTSMNPRLKYVGYVFTKPTKIEKIEFILPTVQDTREYNDFTMSLDYSDDGNDWSSLYSFEQEVNATTAGQKISVIIPNSSAHNRWRVSTMTGNGIGFYVTNPGYYLALRELQFYQRTVQTNIIHSAPNDTIYMLEDGDPIVLATTNSDGDGILDFSQLPAGPVTLYSSVAKNPDDLTADYSKTITITKTQYGGTTEAYLMPDTIKTLYWWGYVGNIEAMSTANGWTSASGFVNPTWNVNSISLSLNTNGYVMGVGTKSPLTLNSVKFHVVGNWSVSGSGVAFSNTESSKQGVGGNQISAIFTVSDIGSTEAHYVSGNITTNNEIIGFAIINATSNATMKAWWYE